ncbi:type II CRISPR-associated endonuclease Cas1 [Lactobacillus mulieris]|uniref:type II CRISPR-associated endonuclease Cas1 n=1 Tax=Lactobacillus mulieris TaxID=2508708 RepID=UPI001432BE8B|nr:type II CRISPR-associated endonuclease Cas1 [Lactobacillus mulieris]MCF1784350.1 type II CRISPR-associated endonuclease Cas1 [Lactobacillus mulieris]MCW8105139.1 type II CRISPR-associated endonuclease Cas1 [Lactobacillus mulieris]MDK6803585.1 type II CRISPR-associated endonuclease Cas1 [Lactobacillus mulieris]MDK8382786.1 type II CRISPR-associated endonuclease Cas1 [Lactobacillus mulieris]MDT9620925.1 type II CRISPR-associated endonuclease Cas1 [Lactobacillus mulieris]
MSWRNVIITQHSKLSYSANMMQVQTSKGITQIPLSDIALVLVESTQVVITSQLISKLAERGCKVIFVDNKYNPITETVNYYAPKCNYQKLLAQLNWDNSLKEKLWTKIVWLKMNNQLRVLKNYKLEFTKVEEEINKLEFNDVSNREAVVAREYFQELFGKSFVRQDEGDTINAALNYGYSILLSSFNRRIVQNGYETYLGIHHSSIANQFNLASDLMEPFRPFVDYWVAGQKLKDFTPDVRYGLVELLSLQIKYNGKAILLANAIDLFTKECLGYLSSDVDKLESVMDFVNEVPNHAIVDNV